MNFNKYLYLLLCLNSLQASSQQVHPALLTDEKNNPISGAHIRVSETGWQTTSNQKGLFTFQTDTFSLVRLTITSLGYDTLSAEWKASLSDTLRLILTTKSFILPEAEVLALREKECTMGPSLISSETLKNTAVFSMAEGLAYTAGVRVENNCQSCGYTGVRINGLDGRYSRILINGRAILGPMAAVYGLEHFPAPWIETLEISTGSRQPLWGAGGGISGTLNLISKNAACDRSELSIRGGAFSRGEADLMGSAMVSRSLKSGKTGFLLAYTGRYRSALDLNRDGLSDIPRLHNQTFISEWFTSNQKGGVFRIRTYYLFEQRRGGNEFDNPFHLTDITEALTHHSVGTDIEYSVKQKSVYLSVFATFRNSYYGSGGNAAYQYLNENNVWENGPLTPTDSAAWNTYRRALKSYGNSLEIPFVFGYSDKARPNEKISLEWGAEVLGNHLRDQMPFYGRSLNENILSLGLYSKLTWKPHHHLTLNAGFRGDIHYLQSLMVTGHSPLNRRRLFFTPLPRINLLFEPLKDLSFSLGYSRGYRLPRIGDEELHISLVGGDVLLVMQEPGLKPESSDAADVEIIGNIRPENVDIRLKAGAFINTLSRMFLLGGQTEKEGYSVIEKRNAGSALIWGLGFSCDVKWKNRIRTEAGITGQWSTFQSPMTIWENDAEGLAEMPELARTQTDQILRNPGWYGYGTLAVTPGKWDISISAVFSGSMQVPYVSGPLLFPETQSQALREYTELRKTPAFADIGVRISKNFTLGKKRNLSPELGVNNLLNAFQKDLGTGILRDPGYQYGPLRPRFFFAGMRIAL